VAGVRVFMTAAIFLCAKIKTKFSPWENLELVKGNTVERNVCVVWLRDEFKK